MKQFKLSFLLFVLMSMICNKASAHDAEIDGIYYNFSGSEATVTYKGDSYDSYDNEYSGSVVIPETVNYNAHSYDVTSIGEKAFYNCTGLTSICLPNNLAAIGQAAFCRCSELSSIELPNTLLNIGSWAFESCIKLQSVYIPLNVNEIGINPFVKCERLQYVSVSPQNSRYDSNGINGIVETSTGKLIMAVRNAIIPDRIKIIGTGAFQCVGPNPHASSRDIDCSIFLPEGVVELESDAAVAGLHVGTLKVPSTIKKIGYGMFGLCYVDTLELADIKTWCEAEGDASVLDFEGDAIERLYHEGVEIKDLVIPNQTNKIRGCCFAIMKGITSVVIPSSVKSIGYHAFYGCTGLTSVMVEWAAPISIDPVAFANYSNVTLYVPRGCKAAYEAANNWKDFKEIVEYDPNVEITMGSNGITTYSNNSDLNFTSVNGLKAYIASGFNPATGNLTMTRVYEVPAGEGLILKGATGSYDVPYEETSAYYANLLVGVPTATTVSPTVGDYTNFILSKDEVRGIGFYPLASAGEIGANKAYLQLPTSIIPAASRSLRMVFDDEEKEVTGVNALNDKSKMKNDKAVYDLQGRRVMKPTRGLYIKGRKKVMVK